MLRHPLRKEDVMTSLLKVTRQPTAHLKKKKKGGDIPSNKLRSWTPWDLSPDDRQGVRAGGGSKTIVEGISGHAKANNANQKVLKSLGNKRGTGGAGALTCGDGSPTWRYTFFREHKEAVAWTGRRSQRS